MGRKMPMISEANAVAKWVAWVENEIGLGANESLTRDAGDQLPIHQGNTALEHTANHAFLPPNIAFAQFAIGIQTRQLGACACAARRAVIGFARAQDEIFAI